MKMRNFIPAMLAVALMALTACNNDIEGTGSTKQLINFSVSTVQMDETTRASYITSFGDNDQFGAISFWTDDADNVYSRINKETVAKDASTSVWRTQRQHYWPAYKKSMSIYAYYPTTLGTSIVNNEFSYTVPTSLDSQEDIMASTVTYGQGQFATTIPLQFTHLLSGVYFTVGTGNKAGTIKSITIKNAKNTNTYSFASADWGASPTGNVDYTKAVNYVSDGNDANTAIIASTNPIMLMPQELGDDFSIDIVFTDTEGDHNLSVKPQINVVNSKSHLVKGQLVNFKIAVTTLYTIQLTASVTDWGDGGVTSGSLGEI